MEPQHIFTDAVVAVDTAIRQMPQTFEQLRAMSDKELVDLINALLKNALFESVETGLGSISGGSEKAAIYARLQYLTQELVRRDQDKQTKEMIGQTKVMIREATWLRIYTIAIVIMTVVIMVGTIWLMIHPH